MTVGSGNVLIAIIMANDSVPNDVLSSVTWNGTNMAPLIHQANPGSGGSVWLYGLCNPTAGNQNLVVNLTSGTDRFYVSAVSFSGANVSSCPNSAFPPANVASAQGNASSASINIPTATGHQIVSGVFNDEVANGVTMNLTTIDTNTGFNIAVGSNYGSGAPSSVTSTATFTGTSDYGIAGVDVSN
jgi:hypothetical protein